MSMSVGRLLVFAGLALVKLDLSLCKKMTGSLANLQGMPLVSLNLSFCGNITDAAVTAADLNGIAKTMLSKPPSVAVYGDTTSVPRYDLIAKQFA